jgi:hypothetical protein
VTGAYLTLTGPFPGLGHGRGRRAHREPSVSTV